MRTFQDTAQCTDRELVAKARSGSREAMDNLIQRHYQTCFQVAHRILRDRYEAQDEVQNACWKVFARLDQYQGESEFTAWLRRIVTNQCLMALRIRRRAQFAYIDSNWFQEDGRPLDLPGSEPSPERQLLDREAIEMMRFEIQRIPSLWKQILLLHHIEGLNLQDIALRLAISVPAAKARLHRARLELRSRLLRLYRAKGCSVSPAVARRPSRCRK